MQPRFRTSASLAAFYAGLAVMAVWSVAAGGFSLVVNCFLVALTVALFVLAYLVALPAPRRPRGGPMEDPEKTLVVGANPGEESQDRK